MDHQSNRSLQTGNICVQWANLEYHLAVAIWNMIGVSDSVGKILTANLDIKQRATMAYAIAHEINAPRYLKLAIKAVLNELRGGMLDERNQSVHGIHFVAERPDAVMVELHRGKGGRNQRLQLDADLAKLGARIHRTSFAFDEALCRYLREKLETAAADSMGLRHFEATLSKIRTTMAEGSTSGPE